MIKILASARRRFHLNYMISFILIIILCGCDSGLKITEIEIAQHPYKTVYESNVDNELNIKGGKINVITADGHKNTEYMSSKEIEVLHNIDFSCKGKYDVFVYRGDLMCKFSVVVE